MILGNKVRAGAARENPNMTQSSNSSKRIIKVSEFNVEKPIDQPSALAHFKENAVLYFMILVKFRNGNIINLVNAIGKGITDNNLPKVKEASQTLKSQSG